MILTREASVVYYLSHGCCIRAGSSTGLLAHGNFAGKTRRLRWRCLPQLGSRADSNFGSSTATLASSSSCTTAVRAVVSGDRQSFGLV